MSLLSTQRGWRWAMRLTASPLLTPKVRGYALRALGIALPRTAWISDGCFIGSPKVSFGENTGCGVDCFFDGCAPLLLGDGVRLGSRVTIITGTHPIEPRVMRRDLSKPVVALPVIVGRGTWVGANVTVLPGVTIGEGCVIGAGSVVTSDCAPNGMYAGVPARRIRDLPLTGA